MTRSFERQAEEPADLFLVFDDHGRVSAFMMARSSLSRVGSRTGVYDEPGKPPPSGFARSFPAVRFDKPRAIDSRSQADCFARIAAVKFSNRRRLFCGSPVSGRSLITAARPCTHSLSIASARRMAARIRDDFRHRLL